MKRRPPSARPRIEAWKASAGLGTLGIEVVLSVLVGLLGGRALDRWLGTEPYFGVLGFCFGVAAAVRAIWRAWKDMQEVTKREEREKGNPAPVYGVDEKPEGGDAPHDASEEREATLSSRGDATDEGGAHDGR